MGKKYIKEIIEDYLQNRYPEETEDLIRSWLTDKEHKDEKYEALSHHWDKLQVEPDIFIYDSLEQVKERIRELPELLDEPQEEPVTAAVESPVEMPLPEQPVVTPIVAEVAPPVIQLSDTEVTETHLYEMPEATTIISIRNEKEKGHSQEQGNPPVIQLKEQEKKEQEQPLPAIISTPPVNHQLANPWVRQEIEPDDLPKPSIAWWKVAAVIIPFFLLAGSVAYMYFNSRVPLWSQSQAFAFNGENRQIVLPDGSHVWLKAGSSLIYPDKFFEGKERVVELEGEAFFTIQKDTQHPFKVKTSSVDIYVTGTEFNLTAYPEDKQVIATLISGGIRVNLPEEEVYTLQPGQQLMYDKQTAETIIHTQETDTDWTENPFFFYNATLPEILHTLQRRMDIDFQTPGSLMEQTETYTIKFVNGENIDDIMTVLQELVGFSWSRQDSVIEIKSELS